MFSTSILDTIKMRTSVRTFANQNLSEQEEKMIKDYIEDPKNLNGPFEKKARFEYICVMNADSDKGIKLGTYGFIKNPKGYVVGISENDKQSLVNFGFVFEKFVLFLTEKKIGTCWMGGTFNRKTLQQEIRLEKDEFIPCITPVGLPHEKLRLFDKALRYVVKADAKKQWADLFFHDSFQSKLTPEQAGSLQQAFEAVRLGPSASNKQPWRLVLSNDQKKCHFFIEHTPNYSSKLGYQMQYLDIGIAMCHFELACEVTKINGQWKIENPMLPPLNENIEYMASFEIL